MNAASIVARIARIELLASLRDRMTLVYTVFLPLALYPVLFWVMIQGFLILRAKDARTDVRIAVVAVPDTLDAARLKRALEEPVDPQQTTGPVAVELFEALPVARELAVDEDRGWDAVLWFHADVPTELLLDGSRSRSTLAESRIESRLVALEDALRAEALAAEQRSLEDFDPFALETVDLADEDDIAGLLFSTILPLLFVMMTVLGGFYPAVDTTAGEKERKTAETTALLPVPPYTIVLGKILAVALAAAIATTLNVTGMAIAAEHLLAGMGGDVLSLDPPWMALLNMAPYALVFLFFTSCVLVATASLTRTFKQGQSMLGLVQLVFLVPAMIGTLPVFDLSLATAWIPVAQTSLVFKALLQGDSAPATASPLAFAVVLVTGLAYAALATWGTVLLRRREDLFDEGFDPRTLLPFRRKRGTAR